MTDDELDESDFNDPTHDPIRALLSAARVDSPIPSEVAARLDAALAELTGKDVAADHVVVPLRRRLAPRLLAAAAVVLVAGAGAVGLTHVLNDNGGAQATSASADAASQPGLHAPKAAPVPSDALGALGNLENGTARRFANVNIPVLTTADFAQQIPGLKLTGFARLDAREPTTTGGLAVPAPRPSATSSRGSVDTGDQSSEFSTEKDAFPAAAKARNCVGPKIAGTTSYPIVLDGKPAVLVVHPASGGSQLFEAWSCNGSQVLAFTTVPS